MWLVAIVLDNAGLKTYLQNVHIDKYIEKPCKTTLSLFLPHLDSSSKSGCRLDSRVLFKGLFCGLDDLGVDRLHDTWPCAL